MKLVDTDVLIDHLRGRSDAVELLRSIAANSCISVLSRFEILAGMRSGERHVTRALLDAWPNVAVTQEAASRAGEMARIYRASHQAISPVDYLLAATVEVHGHELITLNTRHYPMFPDLEAPY